MRLAFERARRVVDMVGAGGQAVKSLTAIASQSRHHHGPLCAKIFAAYSDSAYLPLYGIQK